MAPRDPDGMLPIGQAGPSSYSCRSMLVLPMPARRRVLVNANCPTVVDGKLRTAFSICGSTMDERGTAPTGTCLAGLYIRAARAKSLSVVTVCWKSAFPQLAMVV